MNRVASLLLGAMWTLLIVGLAHAEEVHWKHLQLDSTFRSEGVATADVNRDGNIDVLVGDVWYEAPDWKIHKIRPAGDYNFAHGYSECFGNFAYDVDGDGWKDQITLGFPGKPCHWYRNPQGRSGHWQQFEIHHSACNESPNFNDVNDDGKPDLILGVDAQLGFLTFSEGKDATSKWPFHRVTPAGDPARNGSAMFYHGLGTGDLNCDGHRDIIIPHGWYEAPSGPGNHAGPWQFHAFRLSKHPEETALKTAHLFLYDLDLDGDQDIIASSAHDFGIWWFENLGAENHTRFQYHLIDESFSQTHALQMADINGDGHQDLITGKRFFAHNGTDPGGKDPVVMVWIEIERTKKSPPTFTLHEIPPGRNTGPGTQFEVRDMNNDHRIDIILSNKKGVHLLLQDEITL
jgi:hypothetical protein